MSYNFYKVLHLLGLFLIFISFGGIFYREALEGKYRKFLMSINGVGVLITLVAGFGLLARLGLMKGWPTWVFAKIAIWVAIVILPSLALRKKVSPITATTIAVLLGATAAFLANYKPF